MPDAALDPLQPLVALRGEGASFKTPTFDLGRPRVPLEKTLRLASELEDDELLRRMAARK